MKKLLIIAMTLSASQALAGSRDLYGPGGQYLGSVERGIGGEQRYYGSYGQYLGRSDTSRATGDTQYYGSDGRYLGEERD